MTAGNLVEVKNLKKYYPVREGVLSGVVGQVKAVDDITLEIKEGEVLGIVGESGCGKSTLARLMLRLIEATSGEVHYRETNLMALPRKEMQKIRRKMQIIQQDPYDSINSRMNICDIVGEPLEIHGVAQGKEKERMVQELLERVGLNKDSLWRYPHSFSGGQRQRVVIARALALKPGFIICDEPVSALDVSIQSQILNLLQELQEQNGLTYMFISHNLSVVRHISNRVGVMYLGKLVEMAPVEELYARPLHPYTTALLSAIPVPNPKVKRNRIILQGDVPNSFRMPSGCRFHTRCRYSQPKCKVEEPALRDRGGSHLVACHCV